MKRAKMERGAFPTAGFPIPELAIRSIFLVPVSVPVLDLILTLQPWASHEPDKLHLGARLPSTPPKKKKKLSRSDQQTSPCSGANFFSYG